MAFNKNTDYQSEMEKYLKSGGKKTDSAYKAMQASRDEKILSDPDLYAKYGSELSKQVETSKSHGGGMGGTGEAISIITQAPGWEGAVLDGFNSVEEMQDYHRPYLEQTQKAADPLAEYQEYIRQLQEAQRQSRIAALDKARSNALTDLDTYKTSRQAAMDTAKSSNLTSFQNALDAAMQAYDTEGAAITPAYYEKRRQATGASDIGAMNFAQYMASRGIKGSAGAMPEIYRNAGLNQQIGALNQAEAADVSDLAGRRSTTQNAYNANVANLENAYNTDLAALNADYEARKLGIQNSYDADVAGANADIDAQGLQAYIDQMNADRAYGLQEAAMTGYLNGTPTLEGMQYQQSQQDAQRQQWLDTIGQYSNDYQAEIDKISADNDPSNDWQLAYLRNARQQKLQQQAEQQAAAAAQESEDAQQAYKNALQMWQTYGTATSQIASVLGVPVGARTADYNIASMNAAANQTRAQNSANNANKQNTALSATQYFNQAKSMLAAKDEAGNPKYTREQFENWLAGLPIDDQTYDELVAALNLDNADFYEPPIYTRGENGGYVSTR